MALLIILLFPRPALSICRNPRIVSACVTPGTESYIYTPTVSVDGSGSTVSDRLVGAFWAMGSGDPSSSVGDDNGSFAALGSGADITDSWVQRPTGYPATLHTTWAATRKIDGCIDDVEGVTKCTAVLLSDEHDGVGYFSVLTAKEDRGNYFFGRPGNAPIRLAPIPWPIIDGVPTSAPDGLRATIRVPKPSVGAYVDAACPSNILIGARIYRSFAPRGAAPPADRNRRNQVWESITEAPTNVPFDDSIGVTFPCPEGRVAYVAASLVFDSGFETTHLSANSQPLLCGTGGGSTP